MTEVVKKMKYWLSPPPDKCDIGGEALTTEFVDGKTTFGPWGFMCPKCFRTHGVGLGLGLGQRYNKQEDGRWLKTGG